LVASTSPEVSGLNLNLNLNLSLSLNLNLNLMIVNGDWWLVIG